MFGALLSSKFLNSLKEKIGISNTDVFAHYWASGQATTTSEAALNFNTKVFDTHNAVTTGASWSFAVPTGKAGWYVVHAGTRIQDSGVGFNGQLFFTIRKNNASSGDVVFNQTNAWTSGTPYPSTCGSIRLWLNEGDVLYSRQSQPTGALRQITSADGHSFIQIKGDGTI